MKAGQIQDLQTLAKDILNTSLKPKEVAAKVADFLESHAITPADVMVLVVWLARDLSAAKAMQHAKLCELDDRPIGVLDYGTYAEGKLYPRGAGVSFDGHFWTAQKATSDRPGDGCPSWRLAVRRGKPGRDGRDLRAAS